MSDITYLTKHVDDVLSDEYTLDEKIKSEGINIYRRPYSKYPIAFCATKEEAIEYAKKWGGVIYGGISRIASLDELRIVIRSDGVITEKR